MGAADRLDRGQSTFMKELVETNLIFSRSSNSSLVILDEIGRGTATNDGCAIAHAVLDYLVKDIKCATFFTTHFPILGSLETEFPNALSCMHMSYHQESSNREVVFLYKLVKGITNNSFGLNVARMAQVCEEVLVRAKEKRDEKEAEYLRG